MGNKRGTRRVGERGEGRKLVLSYASHYFFSQKMGMGSAMVVVTITRVATLNGLTVARANQRGGLIQST